MNQDRIDEIKGLILLVAIAGAVAVAGGTAVAHVVVRLVLLVWGYT